MFYIGLVLGGMISMDKKIAEFPRFVECLKIDMDSLYEFRNAGQGVGGGDAEKTFELYV